MKFILTCFIFIFSLTSFAQKGKIDTLNCRVISIENKIERLGKEVNNINEQISYLKEQSNSQVGMLDTAFDGVSSQLGASSNFIAIFAIIIGIISIALGVYVSRIERNIKTIAQDNETLLLKNVQIKQDIENLSNKITSDPKGLYHILRKEESDHLIERLLLVPDDIVNLNTLLLSRELEPAHFEKVKEAFTRSDTEHKGSYDILFFQHFVNQSMQDEIIKDRILNNLESLIADSFKNDIIKSTSEYFNYVHSKGVVQNRIEVNKFVLALSNSKYKDLGDIYISIFNQMSTRQEKFQLYELVEKTGSTKQFRSEYGNFLLDYKQNAPSPIETGILNEIETLNKLP
ncbi:hypothetical protein [Sediminibacterium sp.]|uniref:hypothetical protein n=1 Tax=Sediminibacterium sp. TaxID=1917865 RepID=UPI003F730D7F